jgi:Domain of unknown function (DUF4271)
VSFGSIAKPVGPNNQYALVYDFNNDWITYDQELGVFSPYLKEVNSNSILHSIKINLDDYPGGYLILKTNKGNEYLFFNNLLKKILKKNQWEVFKIEDLKTLIKSSNLVLSIYGEQNPENKQVVIGYPSKQNVEIAGIKKESLINILPKSFAAYQSTLVIIFIITVIMLSFLSNNYNKAFRKFYSFKDLRSFLIKETSFLINKPLDRPNMMFVILLSIITSFVLIICQSIGYDYTTDSSIFQNGFTFGVLIANFFKLTLIIFVSYLLKFFFINIIGKLFNIDKIIEIHYFKLIQISLYFFSILLIILLISHNVYFINKENFKTILSVVLLLFYSLRTIIIYFTIFTTGNVKTLYLISYLCIVEFLPIMIGTRILT